MSPAASPTWWQDCVTLLGCPARSYKKTPIKRQGHSTGSEPLDPAVRRRPACHKDAIEGGGRAGEQTGVGARWAGDQKSYSPTAAQPGSSCQWQRCYLTGDEAINPKNGLEKFFFYTLGKRNLHWVALVLQQHIQRNCWAQSEFNLRSVGVETPMKTTAVRYCTQLIWLNQNKWTRWRCLRSWPTRQQTKKSLSAEEPL